MSDVSALKKLCLSIEDGTQEMTIEVMVYHDGDIELWLSTPSSDDGDDGTALDAFTTQELPKSVGLRLRDFLNYAYPAQEDTCPPAA